MALLTDLGQRNKTVRQLVVWLKKIGNCQALDILEYIGKLTLIRLVKKQKYLTIIGRGLENILICQWRAD